MSGLTSEENKALYALLSRQDIRKRLKAINGPAWLRNDNLNTGQRLVWKTACKAYADGERDIDILLTIIESEVKGIQDD